MIFSNGSRTAAAVAVAVAVALILAKACGGGGGDNSATPSTSASSSPTVTTAAASTTVASTTTVEQYTGAYGPLTGAPISADREEAPALVIKIGNNDAKSRPQTGLFEADVIYEELVEGLKTRFFAVFHSQIPDAIGPVRSGRSSDVHLLAGLSKPLFGYSGGNTIVLRELRQARDAGLMVDVGALRLESAYFRSDDRAAPDNLYVVPADIPDTNAGIPGALFTYGDLPPESGSAVGGVDVDYPSTFGRRSTHVWDTASNGWVRLQDGTLQTSVVGGVEVEVAPANVIVAQVNYGVSAADGESPQARTFGNGPVQVFTRGRLIEGTWSRSAEAPSWNLTNPDGAVIPLAPGSTWVLLAAGQHSMFATADISVIDPSDALKLLSDARDSATS